MFAYICICSLICCLVLAAIFIFLMINSAMSQPVQKENKAVNYTSIISSCIGASTTQCDSIMKDVPYTYTFIDRSESKEKTHDEEPEKDVRFILLNGVVDYIVYNNRIIH